MESIKNEITETFIRNVFPNSLLKKQYLGEIYCRKYTSFQIPRTMKALDQAIIDSWDYEISKEVLRNLFRYTEKYQSSKQSNLKLIQMEKEWKKKRLGALEWPYTPMGYDAFVQRVNHDGNLSEEEKDQIVMNAAVKYRRIKQINTKRNDYMEFLIFEKNSNIIPTLKHRVGVDFYIDGVAYDQKVSRSVGKNFKDLYGEDYRQYAIDHKEEVARCLYEGQDEDRFGYEPRLFIVYLDEDVPSEDIKKIIEQTSFSEPIPLTFDYEHFKVGKKTYQTQCYVILLYRS